MFYKIEATGVYISDQMVRKLLHTVGIRAQHPLVGPVLTNLVL